MSKARSQKSRPELARKTFSSLAMPSSRQLQSPRLLVEKKIIEQTHWVPCWLPPRGTTSTESLTGSGKNRAQMVLWEFALKMKLELGADVGNQSHCHNMRRVTLEGTGPVRRQCGRTGVEAQNISYGKTEWVSTISPGSRRRAELDNSGSISQGS